MIHFGLRLPRACAVVATLMALATPQPLVAGPVGLPAQIDLTARAEDHAVVAAKHENQWLVLDNRSPLTPMDT